MAAPDFRGVADAALRSAHDLVASWLRDGRAEGNEWVAVNPRRPGSDGSGAFRINLHTGAWGDFAGDAKGGDLVSLYAYLNACGQADACRAVAKELGLSATDRAPLRVVEGGAARKPRPSGIDGEQVSPVPTEAPPLANVLRSYRYGDATAHWLYRDAASRVLMAVARWNAPTPTDPGAKEIMPLTLWRMRSNGALAWHPKSLPKPWPLYRLDELARRPDATVLVCEGEKAADAAQRLMPDYVATTSPSGWRNAVNGDWTPLGGRRVLIWPDHDDPGINYANLVRAQLLDAGAASVQVLSFGWVAKVLATARGGSAA